MKRLLVVLCLLFLIVPAFLFSQDLGPWTAAYGDWKMMAGRLTQSSTKAAMAQAYMKLPQSGIMQYEFDVKYVKHAARVGAELGADIVKVNYSGAPEDFRQVVHGCPVPVVIAGGEKVETDEELLRMVAGALEAGAAGASIGRNAFQHADPEGMVRAISMMVHEGASAEESKRFLESRR